MPAVHHYECMECGESAASGPAPGDCPRCGGNLRVRYELSPTPKTTLNGRANSMWRYAEVLPEGIVTLGEGFTPLLRSRTVAGLWIKDEGRNPTGSFHARGASVGVSVARQQGVRRIAALLSGELAAAVAAYCAAAGIELKLSLTPDASVSLRSECEMYGARLVSQIEAGQFSALRPYLLEGTKTIACEVAEQLKWQMPDAIIWPGDAEGVVAIWKGIEELEALGWIGGKRPKIFVSHQQRLGPAVVRMLEQSGGAAVSVTHAECVGAMRTMAREEGVSATPDGAAALVIYRKLVADRRVEEGDSLVAINTVSGYRNAQLGWMARPRSRSIGGIIQPY